MTWTQATREVLNELLGHDDGVEFGNGYHDECKAEIDQALDQLRAINFEHLVGSNDPHTPKAAAHFNAQDYEFGCCERVAAQNALRATQREALDE